MGKRIVFMGTPEFAVSSLDALVKAGYEVGAVVTVPDRQTGRGLKITWSAVKSYAVEHHLPLLQPEKLRDPSFLDELRKVNADLFIVVAFRMLPKDVWSMPPKGTFNLHASLLPQYRGAAPINHAIINGEQETGVSTFMLNERIDEGELLLQRHTPIYDDDNAGTLHDRLAEMGAELVVETADGLFNDTLEPRKQNNEGTLYPAPKIFKQDCAIDWSKNGREINNFIRGLSPYPTATTTMIDSKGVETSLKIFRTDFEEAPDTVVGEITTDRKKEIKIGVKGGFIKVLELQVSGKKRISAEEFLRGYNINNWKITI